MTSTRKSRWAAAFTSEWKASASTSASVRPAAATTVGRSSGPSAANTRRMSYFCRGNA